MHPADPAIRTCDVLVIGGGPAGSTASTLLARQGHQVVLIDKDHHPRFHIGESLLPANMPLLDELGVGEAVRAIGMLKPGAEFVSPQHSHTQTYYFADAWDKSMPTAYQVKRADFDHLLLRNAQAQGVEVHEGTRATELAWSGDRQRLETVTSVDAQGLRTEWRPRFVLDCTGRDTLLAGQLQAKQKNPDHNSAAIYAHFRGARRLSGHDEGNITVFWFDHGWFWFIPLSDGATSVGMVTWPYHMKTRGERGLQQFLLDNIATCPGLSERLRDAEMVTPAEATGNYSYTSRLSHGEGFLLLGDAYAFIDPVFSSGVWLAMSSAQVGARTVDTCLREPGKAPAALRAFDRHMRHGPRAFSWFIYRMTNPTMRGFFMYPRNPLRMKEALLSVLAGDLFGRTPIGPSLLAFKSLYFAVNLGNPLRSWRAWRQRKRNIRPGSALPTGS
ncbi:NAD(P)/FAD-dependent oxidoreductase [Hydrogenophaga crocea]|uniref:NAD(P)/FAD-dependent oxidoreductase n=1 Tax=Hydrogenophaga crocea TaxID=2716225 RepID=A0A6G8IGU2_9BURK|nr:NAD(P)/FAD-dependent oxidoreductase [Hydrogenophaga crocea]QIM52414.1 NAD(P)/FAD-dependent oxidoreductase [Hydrogenophaga crocea]